VVWRIFNRCRNAQGSPGRTKDKAPPVAPAVARIALSGRIVAPRPARTKARRVVVLRDSSPDRSTSRSTAGFFTIPQSGLTIIDSSSISAQSLRPSLAARQVQIAETHPFAEVHDNLIGKDMLPIYLMRCKLAFFGASRFDPRSDKWVRISMFQDIPYPDEMAGRSR
jgi:hypothetical protein